MFYVLFYKRTFRIEQNIEQPHLEPARGCRIRILAETRTLEVVFLTFTI